MKILIIGGTGMLGHKLVQVWQKKYDVWTTIRGNFGSCEKYNIFDKTKTFENLNIENIEALESVVEIVKPDVILNAVGIIKQVRLAKNVVKTLTVNSIFPHRLAEISKKYNSYLINISTDCVFNGAKGNYKETDVADAFDLYGRSKNLGEVIDENCLTIRTSIIGRELNTKHSLVEWFLSNRGREVKGFINAIFSGFPTIVLAEVISELIARKNRLEGLYHVSSEPINKFELLCLLKDEYKIDIEIKPFEEFKIDRSLNSEKFRKAVGFQPIDWRKMVKLMVNDQFAYEKYK